MGHTINEDQLTAECFQWAWKERPQTRRLLFHVPNEAQRNPVRAGQLKAMGLVPGMFDFILVLRGEAYGIEMKLPGGSLSPEQVKVHTSWHKAGMPTFICYSLASWMRLIDDIIEGAPPTAHTYHTYA